MTIHSLYNLEDTSGIKCIRCEDTKINYWFDDYFGACTECSRHLVGIIPAFTREKFQDPSYRAEAIKFAKIINDISDEVLLTVYSEKDYEKFCLMIYSKLCICIRPKEEKAIELTKLYNPKYEILAKVHDMYTYSSHIANLF